MRPASTTPSPSLSTNEQASLAEAERWLGVKYTESERALLLDGLTTRLKALAVRREHAPDWQLTPATTFDPRHFSSARGPERDVLRFDIDPRRPLPTSDEDIAFASVLQLGAWIAAKKITSERLTQLYLERLRRFGPKLECVVTLLEDRAIEQAKERDVEVRRGKVRSVLHGVPWGAKDLLALRGAPTTWGATPYQEQVFEFDAEVISRLDEAGAVLVAKLTLGALAYGDQWFGEDDKCERCLERLEHVPTSRYIHVSY